MSFNTKEHYGSVVIEFKGNVMGGPDAVSLNDAGKTNIVVNLGKVKFMNSSGLGMLIGALTTMRKSGGDLRIANATDKIQSLLVVTKLITVFKHFNSVDEAVESFNEA